MNDREYIKSILNNKNLGPYIFNGLRQSLIDIHLSQLFVLDLINSLNTFDIKGFGERNKTEINEKFTVGFYKDIAGQYFNNEVVPFIKPTNKILDLGCGPGTLANILAESNKFSEVIGADVSDYNEWQNNRNNILKFYRVDRSGIGNFITESKPNSVVMTWSLHHMRYDEQEKYLKLLFDTLTFGSQFVILEDAYSNNLEPIYRRNFNKEFMKWSEVERQKIIAANDWIANVVIAQRHNIPIPFAYRTVEEWQNLFEKIGFKTVLKRYLGFPKERDVNNPQSLLVFERI